MTTPVPHPDTLRMQQRIRDAAVVPREMRCLCGAKTDDVNRSAADKCPECFTFSTDHTYAPGGDNGMRCMDCDVRVWSHR
jgi:hypothetical protein